MSHISVSKYELLKNSIYYIFNWLGDNYSNWKSYQTFKEVKGLNWNSNKMYNEGFNDIWSR